MTESSKEAAPEYRTFWGYVSLALGVVALGCGESPVPEGPEMTGPTDSSATVRIGVTTAGDSIDRSAHAVTVDGEPVGSIGPSQSILVKLSPRAAVTVALEQPAVNCDIDGGDTRTANVTIGDTASVMFPIVCRARIVNRIVYSAGREIRIADRTGTTLDVVSVEPLTAFRPVVSNDGTRIAFAVLGVANNPDNGIYVVNVDGTGIRRLLPATDAQVPVHCSWSSDDREIAVGVSFQAETDSGTMERWNEIHIIDVATGGSRRLTGEKSSDSMHPSWSPTRGEIVFTSGRASTPDQYVSELYVIGADGSGLRRLTTLEGIAQNPAWSASGEDIAFDLQKLGLHQDTEIYRVARDGSNPVRLTVNSFPDVEPFDAAVDFAPSWSPDSQEIIFTSGRPDGTWKLYRMSAQGSSVTMIVNFPTTSFWSNPIRTR